MTGPTPRTPPAPALVLALDGATFDVIQPLVAAGRLPNLGHWISQGVQAPLRSTCPPVTFPAWSTFMTGLEPAQHGIYDFTQKVPGRYRVRFVNASHRRGESLFARISRAGGRVLVLGLPATFPPEPVSGLLVSGFDAPVSVGSDEHSASDPALYRSIAERVGPWMRPSLDETATGVDFHERAVETLLERIESKTVFALEALQALRDDAQGSRPDLMMVVFSESDTVGHHYWRDHDPGSPRHEASASAARRGAVGAVYERLDAACGRLRQAYGEDAFCLVVSDHGMGGAARHIVHLNAYLDSCGFLQRRPSKVPSSDAWARGARNIALRSLPPRLAQKLFRRAPDTAARLESLARFGGFDWQRTRAFSEEANTQPGVWINLRGREEAGCVAPQDYAALRHDVMDALRDWKLPGGGPVVESALAREQVYQGPFADRAPDIVIELALDRGYGLSLVPTPWSDRNRVIDPVRSLQTSELGGGRGRGMNGTHRRNGILVAPQAANGLGLQQGQLLHLRDVAPMILAAMGLGESGEGRPRPDRAATLPGRDYSAEEEALVAARLRALGYLE